MTTRPEELPSDEGAEPAEIGSGELAALLEGSEGDRAGSARRVRSTLRRARRSVGTRDLMVFGLARTWTGLIAVLGGFFSVLSPGSSRRRPDRGGPR